VRKGKPEPIPIIYDGKIFPSRGAMAKHHAPILGKSATWRARRSTPATTPRRSRRTTTHDEDAVAFLEGRIAHGPVPAAELDAEVERRHLRTESAERAKATLGVVARRVHNGRRAVAHLCLPAQAAAIDVY
jgi:hypothetical protein